MSYYAIEYVYGVATDEAGFRVGRYVSFEKRAERDAWVEAGPTFRSSAGYREAIPGRDSELGKLLRGDKRNGPPLGVEPWAEKAKGVGG